MKKAALVALSIAMSVSFVGCSKSAKYTGIYESVQETADEIDYGGTGFLNALSDALVEGGRETNLEVKTTINLKEDGDCVRIVKITGTSEGQDVDKKDQLSGDYKIKDSNITITWDDGNESTGTISEEQLSVDGVDFTKVNQ